MNSIMSKYKYLDIMFWAGIIGFYISPVSDFSFFIALISGFVYFVISITQLIKSLFTKFEKKNISEIELPDTAKQSSNKFEKIKYAFYLTTWLVLVCSFFSEGDYRPFTRTIFFLTIIRVIIAIWDFITRKKGNIVSDGIVKDKL